MDVWGIPAVFATFLYTLQGGAVGQIASQLSVAFSKTPKFQPQFLAMVTVTMATVKGPAVQMLPRMQVCLGRAS